MDATGAIKEEVVTLRPEGPIFPINDLRFDLLDRLPPSREDAELDV